MTELHGVLDQPIDTLSKGFRRRVGLAQAIVHDPDILIMDEPTAVLTPQEADQLFDTLRCHVCDTRHLQPPAPSTPPVSTLASLEDETSKPAGAPTSGSTSRTRRS